MLYNINMDVAKKQHEVHLEAKNKGGRPTTYRQEYCEEIAIFVEQCKTEKRLPTVAGLAGHLDTIKSNIYEWVKKHPQFSDSLRKMIEDQEDTLINNGLSKTYDSKITKLILSANHGMSEKNITEHSVDQNTANLLGLIDGSSKGQLPTSEEAEDAE